MTPEPERRLSEPGRIHRLPREVSEAIAAGEVVDRPASVVKELIENSLDAGATRVVVQIEDGGRSLIRVSDDGWGMTASELPLALERYATSKLAAVEDLGRVRTMGFRGEALASMAAVAKVVAVSRPAAEHRAYEVKADPQGVGGAMVTAAPPGTTVSVHDLFYNLPARRAFLRSSRAEAGACTRVVGEAALARPDVALELRSGGRRILQAPGRGGLREAVRAVLGPDVADVALEVMPGEGDVSIRGLLCGPGLTRPNRLAVVIMVNSRRVQQRALSAAVEGAFRGMLEVDRFPVAVVDIMIDPAEVDVNVHPTKREVRLRNERAVFEALQRSCWEALQRARPQTVELSGQVGSGQLQPAPVFAQAVLPAGLQAHSEVGTVPGVQLSPLAEAREWRFLGQGHNRYLVVETADGLAVLDQHAAHEKVLYERFLASMLGEAGAPVASQGLLEPVLVDLIMDADPVALELLRAAGFDVEVFGPSTVRCAAAPIELSAGKVDEVVREALSETPSRTGADRARHRLAASLACHCAVRFGDPLGAAEASALLVALSSTPGALTCPHGRPAVLALSGAQLLGAFHRR